jgi:hypothetical protein
MDDETRRAIEAIVGAAKAEIVKIIESSKTPEEARIVSMRLYVLWRRFGTRLTSSWPTKLGRLNRLCYGRVV